MNTSPKARYSKLDICCASDMPCGALGDLYHIAPSMPRYIATEGNEVISHSRSEYIAKQKKRKHFGYETDLFPLSVVIWVWT